MPKTVRPDVETGIEPLTLDGGVKKPSSPISEAAAPGSGRRAARVATGGAESRKAREKK